ncbi:MAG: hypothetical protein PVH31_03165 [Ectothiorhodospiraceae bacterium]|jgi:electron transfer flavoprotein beta subunit
MQPEGLSIAVLVSVGRHPASTRPRRSDQDARAVELALRLGVQPALVHAGSTAEEQALRSYLGMGPEVLTVLEQPPESDPVPALADHVGNLGVNAVLTGVQAESGEGSGMTPYVIAERLGWPLVTGIVDIVHVAAGTATLLQALPRGQRRQIRVTVPFVASVDKAAAAPRQSAFGRARRGDIRSQPAAVTLDEQRSGWDFEAARKRPKRLKIVKAKTAAERMKAATAKAQSEGGQVIRGVSPEEGAEAILKLLADEGVLRR